MLSSGLLAHLVDRHKGARFTIACGAQAAPLFDGVPGLERVIPIEKRAFGLHWIGLWARLVGRRYDLVVDLRASLIAYLLLARERRVFRPDARAGHRMRQLGAAFHLDSPPAPRLWTLPRHQDEAARLIPAGLPVIALGPTANWPGKVWPADRFAKLAARLTATDGILPGARVAVFAAVHERDQAAAVGAAVPSGRLIDLAGRVDLLTAYACLQRCAFFVGNDSGLMHLAAAAGVPTLGLFGPSKDELYAPWGEKAAAVRTDLSFDEILSRPGYDRHRTGTLMESLSVDKAEKASRDLWARVIEQARVGAGARPVSG
ncbi:MAG: glycosyltransferase family 9 protein [Alphaproteobacteria bacterium]